MPLKNNKKRTLITERLQIQNATHREYRGGILGRPQLLTGLGVLVIMRGGHTIGGAEMPQTTQTKQYSCQLPHCLSGVFLGNFAHFRVFFFMQTVF